MNDGPVKLAIFDLDGTLVDSLADLTAAVNYVRRVFRLPRLTDSEVKEILGSGQRLIEKALPEASPAELERAQAEYLSYSETHLLESACIYPGVGDTLAALKGRGVLMSIFSNKHPKLSHELLKRLRIDSFFSAILGPDSGTFLKPSPEPVLNLLSDLHLEACEGVVVGDGLSDILAGRRAGVVTVGCSYGYGNASELADADYRISSMPELLSLPLFDGKRYKTPEECASMYNKLKGLKR